jgi:hypothetical protein
MPSSDSSTAVPAKLKFVVSRIEQHDFSSILRPRNRRGGDLATPPIPLLWPVDPEDSTASLQRLQYSNSIERKFFNVDPTAHQIKACTPEGEIVSIARWNFFPSGYDFSVHEYVDREALLPESGQGVMKIELYGALIKDMMSLRRQWQPKGQGCWGEWESQAV